MGSGASMLARKQKIQGGLVKSSSKSSMCTGSKSASPDTPDDSDLDAPFRGEGEKKEQRSLEDFETLEVVGQGGFGKVWKCLNLRDERMYAIKIQSIRDIRFHTNKTERALKLKQIATERSILEKLESPFIVKLHWCLENQDSVFLVLDYIPGGTLFELQSSRVPHQTFTEIETEFYIMETFLGLTHLHAHDICFRDLKPENLLIDANGHVTLSDFGLSKQRASPNSRHQSVLGTPEYMAPEIVSETKEGYSFEVDFWALGCLTYECLHGVSPFSQGPLREIFINVIAGKHAPFSKKLSKRAKSLIKGLLEVDPARRLKEAEIKAHLFFNHYSWADIAIKANDGPIIPERCLKEMDWSFNGKLGGQKYSGASFRPTKVDELCKATESLTTPTMPNWHLLPPEHVRLLEKFCELRSESCLDRDKWASILDERFMYVLPSSVYRNQSGTFNDDGHQKVLLGIDLFIRDLFAGMSPIIKGSPMTGKLKFKIDHPTIIPTLTGVVWSGFLESHDCPARSTIILCMKISPENKIVKVNQSMDVLGFGRQMRTYQKHPEQVKIYSRALKVPDFEVLGRCGKGQFGTVWRARSLLSGEIIAIKSQLSAAPGSEAHHALIQESTLQGKLDYPFIVRLLGSIDTGTHFWSIIEFVSGGDLHYFQQKLPRQCIPADAVKLFASEIYLALAYLHSNTIIFRDLKPQNILIDALGHTKLTDFGLAQVGVEFTISGGKHQGNIEYTAPELISQNSYSSAIDWWAYGCLVYEMLTGASPFHEDTVVMLHDRIVGAKRHSLEDYEDSLVADFVDAFLVAEPTKRLQGDAVKSHNYFSGRDWLAVQNRAYENPTFKKLVEIEKSHRPTIAGNDVWQLKVAKTFFRYRTACHDNLEDWAEIVEDMFVFGNPYLPYRGMAASHVCDSTQVHFVIGTQELVEDMLVAKESQSVQIRFDLNVNEFHASSERAIGSITVSAGDISVTGAAKMTFSCSKKLTWMETCFDLNAFMTKLKGQGITFANLRDEDRLDSRSSTEIINFDDSEPEVIEHHHSSPPLTRVVTIS